MGEVTHVSADDGHRLSAYLAPGSQGAAPGLVVLQEIFGVTKELRELADSYAARGFRVVVPALYDRIEADYVLAYEQSDLARAAKNQLRYDEIAADIRAAIALADTGAGVALLGFCWGGGLAYWMAQNSKVDALVSYYGTNLAQYCQSVAPAAACQFHFGVDDPMIDAAAREAVRSNCKATDQYFEYAGAGHAFANVARPSYRKEQAELAEDRAVSFLRDTFASGVPS